MTVSVVIPCYNARPWIRETLASVLRQAVADLEIIVVDDGSSDGSAEVVRDEFPAVRLLSSQRAGPSGARNLGTACARGEVIQYLDADDLLAPGKIARQLAALEASRADVAYGAWRELRPAADGTFAEAEVHDRRLEGSPEVALLTDFWCPPAAYLFRRTIVERVGGWSERLPVIQDARFVLDCALQGGQFVYCPGLMAYYRRHRAGSVSTRDSRAFTRDCLRNAAEVESWWRERGALNGERVAAVVHAYSNVARASFGQDAATFQAAYAALERLQPGYVPASPRHLALASRLLGYPRAEAAALWYRRAKHAFRSLGLGRLAA